MKQPQFDFYDRTSLKSYNLDKTMRYQLDMLDTLDVFTRKHCENVAALTCRLCEYLHCNQGFIEYCTICAYLHDIGKLFIPPSILQKPSRLTDEEYEIMKTHTTLGYEMCMKDLKLRPYAAGPLYHHEALNGTGYPQGLKRNKIPYEGQIIRVADEYDAIVSKRQYKSHVGISDTLQILVDETKPSITPEYSESLSKIAQNTIDGKNNPVIVRTLFKVVIDDIQYEIFCTSSYIDELENDIKRTKQMQEYKDKMLKSKSQKRKDYYSEGVRILAREGENADNIDTVHEEYVEAKKTRKAIITNLQDEIKKIKKIKI